MSKREEAKAAVLEQLAVAPSFAYDLSDATGIGAGRIYRTLARLEKEGLVASHWDDSFNPPRRRYRRVA